MAYRRMKTGRISVTRQFEFAYAHHLPGYQGKCSNLHGHNAMVEVTLSRSVPEFLQLEEQADYGGYISAPRVSHYGGMVVDFGHIKESVRDLLGTWDHSTLNDNETFTHPQHCPSACVPTAENMALLVAYEVQDWADRSLLGDVLVERVRVYETPNNYAEWHRG